MSHGSTVRLGMCLGFRTEPSFRYGRLVGIRRRPDTEMERYIVRRYSPGDGEFPTGSLVSTSSRGLVPHTGEGCPS